MNHARFCDPDIDDLVDRAGELRATDAQAADELWARIDRRLTEAAPWVPLTNANDVHVVSERLRNYQYHSTWGPLIAQLWVQ